MTHIKYYQYILITLISLCWGIHPSISKLAMEAHANAYMIVLMQNISIIFISLLINTLYPLPNIFNKKHIKYALSGSVLNYGIAIPVMTMTTKHILISHILFLIGLAPLLTYLIALMIRQSSVHRTRLIGSIITLLALLILFPNDIVTQTQISKWYLIILLTPLALAILNNIIKAWAKHELHVVGLVFFQNVFSACLISLILFFTSHLYAPIESLTPNFLTLILVLSILHLSGQLFFYRLMQIANIVFTSQAGNLSIIIGVLWAIFIGHEVLSTSFFIAMATMLYGVYLTQK